MRQVARRALRPNLVALDAELSAEEAAGLLGLSRSQVYARLLAGLIPAQRIGTRWRILKADVERLMVEGSAPPRAQPAPIPPELLTLLSGGELTFSVTVRLVGARATTGSN